MYIKSLQLKNFRNYKELNIEFNKGINIFTGDNAQGKTNILESIYFCALGRSHRTNKDKELINWNSKDAYMNLYVCKKPLDKKIEIKIFKEGKKGININSIKLKKMSELMGVLNVVIFSPEDLKIVKDSPSYRRKFLDIELCKLSTRYYFNLVQYNKILNERNTMLKNYKEDYKQMINIYNEQLSQYGGKIIKDRMKYIDKLNKEGKQIHNEITSGLESIEFGYISDINKNNEPEKELEKLFEMNMKKDILKRNTSVGPHRDDFFIKINGIDTRHYGSQGQQRTSILTIKFASLKIIKEYKNSYPVLLLDDVLSELDLKRQKYILNSIKEVQTIITCTGMSEIQNHLKGNYKLFNVKEGKINEIFE